MLNKLSKVSRRRVRTWQEIMLGVVLGAFGSFLLACFLFYLFSLNSSFFLPLALGIISFVTGLPFTLNILFSAYLIVFCFELFYFKTESRPAFYIYYALFAPLLVAIVTLWLSYSLFPLTLNI